MEIITCKLDDVKIFIPDIFKDERGYFFESWNEREFYKNTKTEIDFVQDNVSYSKHGVIRGLHFQYPNWQDKFVSVLKGEIIDYAVDIRRNSLTFGEWEKVNLSNSNGWQFFIPKGFAHGFEVLSEDLVLHYKCSDFYYPDQNYTLQWNDVDVNIDWTTKVPNLSKKDSEGLSLEDVRKLIHS